MTKNALFSGTQQLFEKSQNLNFEKTFLLIVVLEQELIYDALQVMIIWKRLDQVEVIFQEFQKLSFNTVNLILGKNKFNSSTQQYLSQ